MRGALFYLVAYVFMIAGTFGVVALLARRHERHTSLDDYRNLFHREPVLAAVMTFFLFAMTGIPGTSGFVAKFAVFSGVAAAHEWVLLTVATVSTVISAFFYLRLVTYMYMQHEAADGVPVPEALPRIRWAPATAIAILITVFFTIQLGILPQGLLDMAAKATFLF